MKEELPRPRTKVPQPEGEGAGMRPVTLLGASPSPGAARQQLARDLINGLFVLLKTAYLHKHDNDALIPPLRTIQKTTEALLDQNRDVILTLRLVSGTFFLNNDLVRLDQGSFTNAEFLRIISSDLEVGEYELHAGLDERDLREMMAVIIDAIRSPGGDLRRDFDHIHLKPPVSTITLSDTVDPKELALRTYVSSLVTLARLLERWRAGHRPALSLLKRMVQRLVDVVDSEPVVLLGLMRLSRFQRHPASHLVNTAVLALAMGRRVELGRPELVRVGLAALLHEVGLIELDPELCDREDGLDAEGVRELARLPVVTVHRLFELGARGREALPRLIASFENRAHVPPAGVYHFRATTSILAQLLAVADAYAHLTTPRLGTPALRPDTALGVLLANPEARYAVWAVRLLGDTIGRFPIGTVVELDSGERAIVFDRPAPGAAPTRPKVRILRDGTRTSAGGPIVDLSARKPDGEYAHSIARAFRSEEIQTNVPHFFLD